MKTSFFSLGILSPNRDKTPRAIFACAALLATALLFACSTIATYDQVAYEHVTSAKVDTLALMDKAIGDYGVHEKEVAAVTLELDKAYEYDKGRPLNEITVKQWELLLSPDHDLVGGFLRDWKQKSSLRPVFISEKKRQIGKAFDQIIQLESGKLKPSQVQ